MQINSYRPNAYPQVKASQPHQSRSTARFSGGEQTQTTTPPSQNSLSPYHTRILKSVHEFQQDVLNDKSPAYLNNVENMKKYQEYRSHLMNLIPVYLDTSSYSEVEQKALETLNKAGNAVEKKLEKQNIPGNEKILNDIISSKADVKTAQESDSTQVDIAKSGSTPASETTQSNEAPGTPTDIDKTEPVTESDPPKRSRGDLFKLMFSPKALLKTAVVDALLGTAIGAIIAIGSPVMAVTVPISIAICVGTSMLFKTGVVLFGNPNSDWLKKAFQKRDENNQPQPAKNAEESSSS